jgi:hypothetical protein
VSGQLNAQDALLPEDIAPRYPLDRKFVAFPIIIIIIIMSNDETPDKLPQPRF